MLNSICQAICMVLGLGIISKVDDRGMWILWLGFLLVALAINGQRR